MSDQAQQTGGALARWAGRIARAGIALGIVGATAGAVMVLHDRAGAGVSADTAPPVGVATAPLEARSGYQERRRFAGRLEAARSTHLGFERGGKVVEVLVEEGDEVAEGDPIARLDTEALINARTRMHAAREAQTAMVELARLTDERQASLTDRAVSAQRRDEARLERARAIAELAETEAALDGIEIDLDKSELRAPYAGRIAGRSADEGAIVASGSPVVEIIETGAPQARIGLAPDVAGSLIPGSVHTLVHRGTRHDARLVALRPDIDTGSRTVTALFALDPAPGLVFGDVIHFEARTWHERRGYWVPLSALTEGTRGLWSLLILAAQAADADPVVARAAVRILTVAGEEAFVAGAIPDGATLIPDGTHRVLPGQPVRIAAGE